MNADKVRKDFDEIARLADHHRIGTDRYDSFLLSLVPCEAMSVLDVGCGLGRLSTKLANSMREVLGVDLSPEMISRARQQAGAFPETPPYSFAMLSRDDSEIMLQRAPRAQRADARETIQTNYGWAVYLRTSGEDLLGLATAIGRTTPLIRGPEHMFYGLVEFEIVDPDGYRICVSGPLPVGADLPDAGEREGAAP